MDTDTQKGKQHEDTQGDYDHEKMKAKIAIMLPYTMGYLVLIEAGRGKDRSSLRGFKRNMTLSTP